MLLPRMELFQEAVALASTSTPRLLKAITLPAPGVTSPIWLPSAPSQITTPKRRCPGHRRPWHRPRCRLPRIRLLSTPDMGEADSGVVVAGQDVVADGIRAGSAFVDAAVAPVADQHAGVRVAEVQQAGNVRADVVVLDQVARGVRAEDDDAAALAAASVLPEMTLRWAAVAPPTVLFGASSMITPSRLPRAAVPAAFRPMRLPSIRLPVEVAS